MANRCICELCGSTMATEGICVADTSLCTPCNGGDFGLRLAERGFRFQWWTEQWHPTGGEAYGGGQKRVRGAIPYDLGISGKFSKEDWFSKVEKFFLGELQINDPEFDAAVYIQSPAREPLGEALKDPHLRTAIRNLMEGRKGKVAVEGGTVYLETFEAHPEDMMPVLRDIALVLLGLEKRALAIGLPRQPELATYPDWREKYQYVKRSREIGGDNRYLPQKLVLENAVVDHLAPVVRVHDVVKETSKPLEALELKNVWFVSADLSHLPRLSTLRELVLDRVLATQHLPQLNGLRHLSQLTIANAPVSNIAPLAGLTALRQLRLCNLPLKDIAPLASLKQLEQLDLRGTQVADLQWITGLTKLKKAWIAGLPITQAQLSGVRCAIPGIEFDPY